MRDEHPRSVKSVVISVGVHAAVIALIVWQTTGRNSGGGFSLYGEAASGPPSGLASGRFSLPQGPSISPEEGRAYEGHYSVVEPGRPNLNVFITFVNDDVNHWSVRIQEGESDLAWNLVPVVRDTFLHSADRKRRIIFIRRDTAVTGIELHNRGSLLRGLKRD